MLVSRRRTVVIAVCVSAPLCAEPANAQLTYTTLDFGTNGTVLTGIRGDTITGHYVLSNNDQSGGLLYNLSTGTWTAFPVATASGINFPGAVTSSPYSSSFGSQFGILNAVGSYQSSFSSPTLSYLYDAVAAPGGQLTTLFYPSAPRAITTNTTAHSTFGNQVVGGFATEEQNGSHVSNAFVYNISNGTYRTEDFPGAISTTAYGVWGNMIVGGYKPAAGSSRGYTYNESTGVWTSYNFPGAAATHFEGISGGGSTGTYNVAADWISDNGRHHAAVLHIGDNGSQTWINLAVPGAVVTSANSIYANNVVGVYNDFRHQPPVDYMGYIVTIPGIYTPIQNTGLLAVHSPTTPAIAGANGDDVINEGTIRTTAVHSDGIRSGAFGVITNAGLIEVSGVKSSGVQMIGEYGTLLNAGSIVAGTGTDAIQTGPMGLGTAVVNNGTINGQIAVTAADARFENSGWLGISAPGAGAV